MLRSAATLGRSGAAVNRKDGGPAALPRSSRRRPLRICSPWRPLDAQGPRGRRAPRAARARGDELPRGQQRGRPCPRPAGRGGRAQAPAGDRRRGCRAYALRRGDLHRLLGRGIGGGAGDRARRPSPAGGGGRAHGDDRRGRQAPAGRGWGRGAAARRPGLRAPRARRGLLPRPRRPPPGLGADPRRRDPARGQPRMGLPAPPARPAARLDHALRADVSTRARISTALGAAALAVVVLARASAAGDLTASGFALARGIGVEGPTSWLAGGFGRLAESGRGGVESAGGAEWVARGEMSLALDWRPSPRWTVHAHGLARAEPTHAGRAHAGVTEAFVEFRPELTPSTSLRVRLGTLFLPTSRENTGPLWASPYTLAFSALDTWMGEEMRPTALEVTLRHKDPGREDALQATAALFGGADTLGALLAWRGWAMGDRLVTMGESLRLPPLSSLAPGGAFGRQRAGTTPIAELDGRPGWMAAARWSHGERPSLQAWALDNGVGLVASRAAAPDPAITDRRVQGEARVRF